MEALTVALNYCVERDRSRQWEVFLKVFAAEISREAPAEELRGLMRRLGRAMAGVLNLDAAESLGDFERVANDYWQEMGWGWVQLVEQPDHLLVQHYGAPLRVAFGDEALAWTPALLEGLYEEWLRSLGAPESLRLRQHDVSGDGLLMQYQLAKS